MFIDYKADREMPLPMIFQGGYLTIKAVDRRFNTYLLDFPNQEVREGFVTLLTLAGSSLSFSSKTGTTEEWEVE